MKRTRRTFGRDFKLKAVRYVNSSTSRSLASIAKELEIDRQALWAWTQEVADKGEDGAFPGSGRHGPNREITRRVQRAIDIPDEIEPLLAEIEILRMKLERTRAERDASQRLLNKMLDIRAAEVSLGGA